MCTLVIQSEGTNTMYMELENPCRKENGCLRVKGDLSVKVVIILVTHTLCNVTLKLFSSKDKIYFFIVSI